MIRKIGKIFIVSLITVNCSLLTVNAEMSTIDADKYIPMQNAVVRVMNKAAGRTHTVTIPVGEARRFDKIEILVRRCLGVDEFLPEDFFMFVEVNRGGRRIFSGWMTQSEPGKNPLQDPDNDLWLVRCE